MRKTLAGLGLLALLASLAVTATGSGAADHLEAPFVQRDGRTDINDIYAFESPTAANSTVVVMTVNPGAGVISGDDFDDSAAYRFNVDTNGDFRPDAFLQMKFGAVRADGNQRWRLKAGRDTILTGRTGRQSRSGDIRAFAGVTDDPFFFDFQAFQDQVKGEGGDRTFCDGNEVDFFAGLNVTAIVVEIPDSILGGPVQAWGETKLRGLQIDRMGIPAINTVLINDGNEDAYNNTPPVWGDRFWKDEIKANLLALSGLDGTPYDDATAEAIADVLSPDVVPFDPSAEASFTDLNGRALDDDVIDFELLVVTGGFGGGSAVLDSDCVDSNDVPFRSGFPYLGEAN